MINADFDDDEFCIVQDLLLEEKQKLMRQLKDLQDKLKRVTLLDISLQRQWLAKNEER